METVRTTPIDRLRSTDPNGPVAFFATPAYAGCHPLYMRSILETTREMCARGWRVQHMWSIHQSLVQNAREELFGQFLASGADWMFMMDGDVGWEPTLPLRIAAFNEPVVYAPVPGRSLNLERLAKTGHLQDALSYYAFDDRDETRARLADARRSVCKDPRESPPNSVVVGFEHGIEDRFFETETASTTWFAMRRDAALLLAEKHPELAIRLAGTRSWALFQPLVEGGMHWGEDISFFARWRRAGGRIWCCATATLSHSGPVTIVGNLARAVEEPEHEEAILRSWPYEENARQGDLPGNARRGNLPENGDQR